MSSQRVPVVDLVVPVKHLHGAKTRLRTATGASPSGGPDPAGHARLALAIVLDTVAAARDAHVRRLLVVTADPDVAAAVRPLGAEVAPEGRAVGLNAAVVHGAGLLLRDDPGSVVGALQGDLPALRADELDGALAEAAGLFAAGAGRVFCADTSGEGTTLLLADAGVALRPSFGAGSAALHEGSGARPLRGDWPRLRRDVDTPGDLADASGLGVGRRTAELVVLSPKGGWRDRDARVTQSSPGCHSSRRGGSAHVRKNPCP